MLVASIAIVLAVVAVVAVAPPAGAQTADWREQMLTELNATRAAAGAAPVSMCSLLNNATQGHANYLRDTGTVSHTGSGGSTVATRVTAEGYAWSSLGENVAAGFPTVSDAMTAWRQSASHYATLVHPDYRHVGFGGALGGTHGAYWVQNFAVGHCPDPFGTLDWVRGDVGTLSVRGWAIDPDAGSSAISVRITVDGVAVATLLADRHRSDVGLAYPAYGPNHGFESAFAASPGTRTVCAVGRNVGAGADTNLGCRSVWVADPASPFWDVLSSSELFDDIIWMVDAGLTTGFSDGSFRPTEPVTRQAMASFLWRASGAPTGPFPDPGFGDVAPGHPFHTPIAWLVDAGIANGYADGMFRPTAQVSRQASVTFLWRLSQEPLPLTLATFSDVSEAHPFVQPISWAAEQGIANGYADGSFRPTVQVSRQASAAFIHRWSEMSTLLATG